MKTLLDDIIALAQNASEGTPPAPDEGADAGQAARTVARLLQPNAWEKRLRLSVNVAAGLPRVAADPRMLRRVLLKLAANAIKFTERGSIEIALDAARRSDNAARHGALSHHRHRRRHSRASSRDHLRTLRHAATIPMPGATTARAWASRSPSG